ncbi:MAG: hypothetical protein OJF51_001063 [Nitrospira sp.]|jgi:hypothetical protein|nr:MAG: hypothetical protein OJF51_001063 [Nitrospira sp.]
MLKKSSSFVLALLEVREAHLVKREAGDGIAEDCRSAAAWHARRRVLVRLGWAGENDGLFEHPACPC